MGHHTMYRMGDHWISPNWFGETWNIEEVRKAWPFLTEPTQRYIASFETLAQFALLQCTHKITRHHHLQVRVPSGTDNTATEAGINKLFTTKWPLSHFLMLIAAWGHAHGVARRISGQMNRAVISSHDSGIADMNVYVSHLQV